MINLNLINLEAFEVGIYGDFLHIKTKSRNVTTICPHCLEQVNFVKSGYYTEKEYRDVPYKNKNVILFHKKQRYKCKECGKVFAEENPDLEDAMTTRLYDEIFDKLIEEHELKIDYLEEVNINNYYIGQLKLEPDAVEKIYNEINELIEKHKRWE